MKVGSETKLYKAERTDVSQNQGKFRTYFNFPGRALPDHADHGYGPLATIVESFMDPETHISMHPHRDEEIISWVPAGVMRHGDQDGNDLVTDADHLMVMNAGETFWHEEFTRADDPPLRMLQMFVRPHSLGLEPNVQHEPIDAPVEGEWRHLFGPEGSDAPLFVRNEVDLFDLRLDAGSSADLPEIEGRDAYFYVFDGAVEAAGTRFGKTESGLLVDDAGVTLTADEDATVVAFLVDPDAPVTRQGTIGR